MKQYFHDQWCRSLDAKTTQYVQLFIQDVNVTHVLRIKEKHIGEDVNACKPVVQFVANVMAGQNLEFDKYMVVMGGYKVPVFKPVGVTSAQT